MCRLDLDFSVLWLIQAIFSFCYCCSNTTVFTILSFSRDHSISYISYLDVQHYAIGNLNSENYPRFLPFSCLTTSINWLVYWIWLRKYGPLSWNVLSSLCSWKTPIFPPNLTLDKTSPTELPQKYSPNLNSNKHFFFLQFYDLA